MSIILTPDVGFPNAKLSIVGNDTHCNFNFVAFLAHALKFRYLTNRGVASPDCPGGQSW